MASMFKIYQKFSLKHKQEEADRDDAETVHSVMTNIVKFPGTKYLKRF